MQSALTGESLPVTKLPGDCVCSGSTCKQGEIEAVVIATGVHTFFGKAAHLVDSTHQVGHFQKVGNKVMYKLRPFFIGGKVVAEQSVTYRLDYFDISESLLRKRKEMFSTLS